MTADHQFYIVRDYACDELMFYYRDMRHGQRVAGEGFTDEGVMKCRVLESGEASRQPLFRLPSELGKLLGEAMKAEGLTPLDVRPVDDSPALKAHLVDAVAVRDRLLTLVERKR